MNTDELRKILDEHGVYVESCGRSGSKANLSWTNLKGADLSNANLSGADLNTAYLKGANLSNTDLSGANLRGICLSMANLISADLSDANLSWAKLQDADLSNADLRGANLRNADLRRANLCGSCLIGANLRGTQLPEHTYVIVGEEYHITITNGEYLRAGCKNCTIEDWRKFTKHEIAKIGGKSALRFYPRLLDIADFYLGKGERPKWLNAPDSENE